MTGYSVTFKVQVVSAQKIPSPGWERARVRVMKRVSSFVGSHCSSRLDASSRIGVWDKLRWHDAPSSPRYVFSHRREQT